MSEKIYYLANREHLRTCDSTFTADDAEERRLPLFRSYDAYSALSARCVELERVSTKLATALASNIGLQLSDCTGGLWDEYRAALSKGSQP